MVARGGEGVGELAENVLAVVVNLAGLAMKNLGRANDFASEGRADGLVSEAHTKNREFPGQSANQIDANPRVLRRAGARRNHDALWLASCDLFDRNFVVAVDFHVATQLTEIL